MLKLIYVSLLGLVLGGASVSRAAEVPLVVVSIPPLHSLATAVMQGVAEPKLLVDGNASPHNFMLKPSQMRALNNASLVLWVGPSVEGFLQKPMHARQAASLALIEQPGMHLLAARSGGVWQDDHHGGHHGHDHHHGHKEDVDGHLWLDPRNAMVAIEVLVKRLSEIDPVNRAEYVNNGQKVLDELKALDLELAAGLKEVAAVPYLVFHDAYHYFEHRYQLNAVGALTIDPDRRPGAKRLREIRERIVRQGVKCVFSEPQFSPSSVSVVLEGSRAHSGVLDPAGAALQPDADLYFKLMRALMADLKGCLAS